MPRFNVYDPDKKKWGCFSSIIDEFVCPFMDEEPYQQWRKNEYGDDCGEIRDRNQMGLSEAIYNLSLNHTADCIIENLRFAGLVSPRECAPDKIEDQLKDAKNLFDYQAREIDVEHIEDNLHRYKNAFLIASTSIGTQIAKSPDIEGDGYSDGNLVYDTWICPSCGTRYELEYDHYHFCPKCGQHIDEKVISDAEG